MCNLHFQKNGCIGTVFKDLYPSKQVGPLLPAIVMQAIDTFLDALL